MRIRIIHVYFLFALTMLQSCKKTGVETVSGTQLAEFNEAEHNAFTDLIKYNGNYYCAFREGSSHQSFDGKLKIVISADSKTWKNFGLLSITGKDLRDPHFFIDSNNVLSIGTNARLNENIHYNVFFKLKDNSFKQCNEGLGDNDYWLWSFTKSNNTVYTIGYNLLQKCFNSANSQKPKLILYQNADADCINYTKISSTDWFPDDFSCPCEASMVLTSDSTLVTVVRDEYTPGQSHIGYSKKPYTNWHWQIFPYFLRGPKLVLLPDGRIFLGAASMIATEKTYYAILNPKNFSVVDIKALVSAGDTGYPGIIIEGNTALISYYSSHKGNARVYIERINY